MRHHQKQRDEGPGEPIEVPSTGMWGTVVLGDGDEVTVKIDEFDQGVHYFGPVRHTGAIPAAGDDAFLHFDHRDRPAYAVIFAT